MQRTIWTKVIGAAAAAAAAASVFAVAAKADDAYGPAERTQPYSGCRTTGDYLVCRTNPAAYDSGADNAIIDELIRRVDATDAGDIIRIAMYEWTTKEPDETAARRLRDSLVEAHNRDAKVQVLLGWNKSNTEIQDGTRATKRYLERRGIDAKICRTACVGGSDGGVNHSKIVLINHDGRRTVTLGSSNITLDQTTYPQNMVGVTGDEPLYAYFDAYWERMWKGDWDGWTQEDKAFASTRDLAKVYVFPRGKGDIVAEVLKGVTECRPGDDKVWVANSAFNRKDVRKQLNRLEEDENCDVRVTILAPESIPFAEQAIDPRKVKQGHTHNKLLVVDAKYAGEWRQVVWTGSHNLTTNSLRDANDAMLRIAHPGVYAMYEDYIDYLYKCAETTCSGGTPSPSVRR